MTKKIYLEKFSFFLSFYFFKDACDDIISDYEDWFNNEISIGRSENKICEEMLSPRLLAKKIYKETENKDDRILVLLKNVTIKTLLLIILHMSLCFYILTQCNTWGCTFLYYGLAINFFIAVIMFLAFFKNKRTGEVFSVVRLISMFIPVLFIIVVVWMINSSTKLQEVGRVYNSILTLAVIILYAYGIYTALKSTNNGNLIVCLLLVFGGAVMIEFTMNQQHMFYLDLEEYSKVLWGNILIYVEMLLLQAIFWVGRKSGFTIK